MTAPVWRNAPCTTPCPLIGGKWKVQILCAVTNAGTIRYNALRGKLDWYQQHRAGLGSAGAGAGRTDTRAGSIWRCRCGWSMPPPRTAARLLPILEQLSDWAEARMPADGATTKKEEPQ